MKVVKQKNISVRKPGRPMRVTMSELKFFHTQVSQAIAMLQKSREIVKRSARLSYQVEVGIEQLVEAESIVADLIRRGPRRKKSSNIKIV